MVYWGQNKMTLPNFTFGQLSCEMGQIMNRYDFLEAR